jgi:hypothetical protein
MGSFDFTCAVSDLPIRCGDPVRIFLLTSNPYGERPCYTTDVWFPRTWPIRAKYNDYGGVEDYGDEHLQKLWLAGFQRDLVERGWGDNSCHDTSTSKDMSFEHLLEALWERRVLVERDLDRKSVVPGHFEDRATDGVPTIRRIAAVAETVGLSVFDGKHCKDSVMIDDDEGYGRVRVRGGDYSFPAETLERVAEAIRAAGYVAVVTGGSGNYADTSEVMVRARPGIRAGHPKDPKDPLRVDYAMIREDVWQLLLRTREDSQYDFVRLNVDEYRGKARAAWEAMLKEFTSPSPYSTDDYLRCDLDHDASLFTKDSIPFTVGLGTHFKMAGRAGLTDEQAADFANTAGEFMFVSRVLGSVRRVWAPSTSVGPQFGEWGLHAKILDGYREIAEARHRTDSAEDEDEDEDEDEAS